VIRHLLVTNDYPPKVGGIQAYLWELWRRLPAESVTVCATPHRGAVAFDVAQAHRVIRSPEPWLLPYPWLGARIRRIADEVGAELVLLDPALPLGLVGPWLGRPYGVVLHGAEVTVPGRIPGSRGLLGRVLRDASTVIAAGGYPAAEAARAAGRSLPTTVVPPGVDTGRFQPLGTDDRAAARRRLGLDPDAPLVVSVSRLVPRKGMDTLIEASARLLTRHPDLQVVIAGSGRDRTRLERLARRAGVPVRFLGRVPEEDKIALYASADVFAMLCRVRWGGLEQEGFGIVFVEAAACGVPQVAGSSGGAAEAVVEGETGFVVDRPSDAAAAATAIGRLLDDPGLRASFGAASRRRAVEQFSYDVLAARLEAALGEAVVGRATRPAS
jgi:phosphatidyl-myo-inositol dimannoside synthase